MNLLSLSSILKLTVFLAFIVICYIFIILTYYPTATRRQLLSHIQKESSHHSATAFSNYTKYKSNCSIEAWNQKNTMSIPNGEIHKKWADAGISRHDNFLFSELRLLSAYVYQDHISVVTGSKNNFRKPVYCRYFDCNRRELPNTMWKSYIFPLAIAFCVRRAGAEYISVSYLPTEEPQDPVPLTFRVMKTPIHELSVCVGPLYGNESKWLEIVEFVEHYRLVGASYFYFTFYNLSEYDRKIVDDYVRLGLAEVHFFQTEYENPGWQFHLLQQSECSQRSKYHSKWVINMDIDERLTPGNNVSIIDYLRSLPDNIGEVSFSTHRVKKTENLPKKYVNDSQLMSDMEFLKYNETSEMTWYNFKGVVRPEKIEGFFYHWSYAQYPGVRVLSAPSNIGFVRHYRSTNETALNGDWMKHFHKFKPSRLEARFENRLKSAVLKRVKYVYDQRIIRCEELPGNRFTYFRRELLDCKFKHELDENEQMKISNITEQLVNSTDIILTGTF